MLSKQFMDHKFHHPPISVCDNHWVISQCRLNIHLEQGHLPQIQCGFRQGHRHGICSTSAANEMHAESRTKQLYATFFCGSDKSIRHSQSWLPLDHHGIMAWNISHIYLPHLGSTISSDAVIDEEVNRRIAKASASFGRLDLNVRRGIRLTIKVYHAVVFSTLLYGSDYLNSVCQTLRLLNHFHTWCL